MLGNGTLAYFLWFIEHRSLRYLWYIKDVHSITLVTASFLKYVLIFYSVMMANLIVDKTFD